MLHLLLFQIFLWYEVFRINQHEYSTFFNTNGLSLLLSNGDSYMWHTIIHIWYKKKPQIKAYGASGFISILWTFFIKLFLSNISYFNILHHKGVTYIKIIITNSFKCSELKNLWSRVSYAIILHTQNAFIRSGQNYFWIF